MPGHDEVFGPRLRVDQHLDRARAVGRRDAGRDAVARLDRDRERRAEVGVLLPDHHRDAAAGRAASAVIGTQIRPRAYLAMKLIASAVTNCGGDDEVALVLAVLVVDDDDEAARAEVLDRLLDGGEALGLFGAVFVHGRCPGHGSPPCSDLTPNPFDSAQGRLFPKR